MRPPDDRFAIERAKWDAHAGEATTPSRPLPPEADFAWQCARDKLMPGVGEYLGDLRGLRVVEYGCGLGKMTVLLARSGAHVSAFDLSERSVEAARCRLATFGLEDRVELVVAPGECLPFPDASFDVAFGKAVLHHIDAASGARELARILRPGGRGAFAEPLGTNPLVRLARAFLPYPGKHERGADIPLRIEDIDAWMAPFAAAGLRGVQLFSMVERGLGWNKEVGPLRYIDRELLRRHPGLWPLCRYGVLTVTR